MLKLEYGDVGGGGTEKEEDDCCCCPNEGADDVARCVCIVVLELQGVKDGFGAVAEVQSMPDFCSGGDVIPGVGVMGAIPSLPGCKGWLKAEDGRFALLAGCKVVNELRL